MRLRVPGWVKKLLPQDVQQSVDTTGPATPNEQEIEVPATREFYRAYRQSLRLRGPGYTRPMRKGRTQRERSLPNQGE